MGVWEDAMALHREAQAAFVVWRKTARRGRLPAEEAFVAGYSAGHRRRSSEGRRRAVDVLAAVQELLLTHAADRSEAGEAACDCDACALLRPLVEAVGS